MSSRMPDGAARAVPQTTISRRRLLAAGGLVVAGGLAGCLDRVASSVTNTGASPAAVFAGARNEQTSVSAPTVRRLTPSVSGRAGPLSGEVDVEGWVTSVSVLGINYNNTRSNRSTIASPDSAVTDEELTEILEYLDADPIVAERFTVCVPDAAVPGGTGSIEAAVTPQRLLDYVSGRADTDGRVYSWGDPKSSGEESGDCDDDDPDTGPGEVCGRTDHLAAAVTGPTATGGGLVAVRDPRGTVTVLNTPPGAERGPSVLVCPVDGDPYEPADLSEWARKADSPPLQTTHQGRILDTFVAQVMVQPPGCPHPFPALLYAGRGLSDDQLVYTGGWVIDDAALYANSVTVLTMADAARVVGIDFEDLDSDDDGLLDATERSVSGDRARRGARIDSDPVDSLVETGVLSEGGGESVDHFVRKRPGRTSEDDGDTVVVTHVALDAPVLHLVNAGAASNEVKFKAGAELSGQVN